MADAGKVMILPRGEYSADVQYEIYDMVIHKNVAYIAKQDVIGVEPPNEESWHKWIDGNFSIPKVDGETITIDENGVLRGNTKVTVDSELSETSANPVENQAITKELKKKANDVSDFTVAENFENIASGETHNTIFGKLAGWFSKIAGKLDKTDVVNNQITTEEGYVLDARQGKVLSDKITALNDGLENKSNLKGLYFNSCYSTDESKTVKIKFENFHMPALLMIDQDRHTDFYTVGIDSGVIALSKTSSVSNPSIDEENCTVSVPLTTWSTAVVISLGKVNVID